MIFDATNTSFMAAYRLGMACYERGKPFTTGNPFDREKQSQEWAAYREGWMDKQEDEKETERVHFGNYVPFRR